MENKLYILREIYDSLSYDLREDALNFYYMSNSFLLGARRIGKTTITSLEAIVEGSLNDDINIAIYTDEPEMERYLLLVRLCDELNLDYARDHYFKTITLPNKSTIKIISRKHRGGRYDYIVADIHNMIEEDYQHILTMCRGDYNRFKIAVGVQNDFVHDYIQNNSNVIISRYPSGLRNNMM